MRSLQLMCVFACLTHCVIFAQNGEKSQAINQKEDRQKYKNHEEKDKGHFLTVSAKLGYSGFDYKLQSLNENGKVKKQPGYGIDVKYSYFFHKNWGVSTGVGVSHYASKGRLQGSLAEEKFHNLGMLRDDDFEGRPRDFELRARITNLEEKQSAYFIDIPVLLSYQTRFGKEKRWGMYGGLGVKLLFPVNTKFKILNGASSEFNISGQYDGIPTDMGSPANPPVIQHGYGTISDPNSSLNWDDKAKIKMGIAGTAEFGFLFALKESMDLQLGGYIDYGFNNIKKEGNKGLFSAPSSYHPGADNKIGNGIIYNGMLNSNITDKIKMISFGAKIALKFQLGGN